MTVVLSPVARQSIDDDVCGQASVVVDYGTFTPDTVSVSRVSRQN